MIVLCLLNYLGQNHARLFSASEVNRELENVIETFPYAIFMIVFRRSIEFGQEEKRGVVLMESPY
jgi:hypothetical protein